MDLDLVFLGTSGSMPTAQRAPAALLVRRGGDKLLFDCAEGTQRQLLRSSVGLVELHDVFLTHFHADHVLGLPGMLKTFALRGRDLPLTIPGPRWLPALMCSLKRVLAKLTYPLELLELAPGAVLECDGGRRATFSAAHRESESRRARRPQGRFWRALRCRSVGSDRRSGGRPARSCRRRSCRAIST